MHKCSNLIFLLFFFAEFIIWNCSQKMCWIQSNGLFHLKITHIHSVYFSSHKRHRLRWCRPCFRYHHHHHHRHHRGMSHHDFDGNADACYAICGYHTNEIYAIVTCRTFFTFLIKWNWCHVNSWWAIHSWFISFLFRSFSSLSLSLLSSCTSLSIYLFLFCSDVPISYDSSVQIDRSTNMPNPQWIGHLKYIQIGCFSPIPESSI